MCSWQCVRWDINSLGKVTPSILLLNKEERGSLGWLGLWILPDLRCLSMNSLHASISLGFIGQVLATFGMKVSLRSVTWSKGHWGESLPSFSSSKTLVYLVHCGGSCCSTFSVAWAKVVESVRFQIWGWFSPSTCQSVAMILNSDSFLSIASRYHKRYRCSIISGSLWQGVGVPIMWTSPVVQSILRLFFISQGYPRIMLLHFLRFSMKKFCVVFLLSILRWSLTWWWIIPPELFIPLAFWVYIGQWSFSRGHFILLAMWRSMQQIVAPLSVRVVVSVIFLFSVL